MRRMLSVFLVYVLCISTLLDAKSSGGGKGPRSNNAEKQRAFKEQVAGIASGSVVEVRLHSKEAYRGRLGQLTDQGFTVQRVAGNSIQDETISFADVKSIKEVKTASATSKAVTWIAVGALAAVAVVIVIAIVAKIFSWG